VQSVHDSGRLGMSQRTHAGPLNKELLQAAVKRIGEQLEHVRSNADTLRQKDTEYDELHDVLISLPEKVTHPVMVPLGPLAFFEGHLEHTGEVLVQLSSEYFELCTTKHAVSILERRKQRLQSDIADVDKEQKELEMRQRIAMGEEDAVDKKGTTIRTDENGYLDIREPYVEEEVEQQPQQSENKDHQKKTSNDNQAQPQSAGTSEDDPLARLRELERMEELEELEELDNIVEKYENLDPSTLGDGRSFVDESHPESTCIESGRPTASVKVRSPADIYRIMSCVDEAAGWVKPMDTAVPESSEHQASNNQSACTAALPSKAKAATGALSSEAKVQASLSDSVCERRPEISSSALPCDTQPTPSSSPPEAMPKRISKFKADRERRRG